MSQPQQVHPLSGAMGMGIQNQHMSQPNIIGNAEDKMQPVNTYDNVEISDSSDDLNQSEIIILGKDDEENTVMPIRSRRKASKTRY